MENEKKKGEKKKREGEDKEAVAYSVNLSESKIFLYLLALDYKGGQFPVLLWATLLLPIISTSFVLGNNNNNNNTVMLNLLILNIAKQ